MVLGLVALAAVVSTTELLATQLFSLLILPKSDRRDEIHRLLVVLFFAVFGGLRLVNLAREMYRLNVFERALAIPHGTRPARTPGGGRWPWRSPP